MNENWAEILNLFTNDLKQLALLIDGFDMDKENKETVDKIDKWIDNLKLRHHKRL